MRHLQWLTILILLFSFMAVGCDPEPTETPEARPLLDEAANQIQSAESFSMEIDVEGYPVEIEVGDAIVLPDDLPLLFEYATGTFVSPDQLQGSVEVGLGEFRTTISMIILGNEQYMRSELLTQDQWVEQPIIEGFSPSSLLANGTGIPYALKSIQNLEMLGLKDLDGLEVYQLRGTLPAQAVYALTFGLIGTQAGQLEVDVYILPDSHKVEQIILREPLPEGVDTTQEDVSPTTWTITMLDYNEPIPISAPTSESES
jgi:hypothetical protein